MNAPLQLHMDKSAFLRWAEGREGHFELKDNQIVMMTGGTRNHARVTSGFVKALAVRLDASKHEVMPTDLAVEIGEDVRYPDVVVEAAGGDGDALSTARPLVVVEVLSKSSLAIDFHIKAAEYMSLQSLEAYIVASQEEPRLWVWNRFDSAADRAWPKEPQEVCGRDSSVPLPSLGLSLPMAEIYAAISEG